MSWKIVDTDNFGSDYPNETVIADSIVNKDCAEIMAKALNSDTEHSRYYKVVDESYVLQPGFEP